MATNDKYDRLKQLMEAGKEKGFVLYDEVNELLPDDMAAGPELDELLADLDGAGVEILEEPKLNSTRKARKAKISSTSIWSRISAIKPTIRCGCICARWAPFRC